jgi:hypothetical protein
MIPTTTCQPIESGAEVRGRAEISGLFAHVTDSGKKLSDGKPVFAEIDPGTPRLSIAGRGLPDIVVVPAGRRKNGRLMRRLILMKMGRGWRYLDRLLHVGLLELVRLVELRNV